MAQAKPASRTLVLLVRHGQTPTTGTTLPGQAHGLHLADKGREQAERGRGAIAPFEGKVAAVYASPLERTRETAAPIAKACGLRVRIERGLLECDFGEWTGSRAEDADEAARVEAGAALPERLPLPGGESFTEMQTRIIGAVERPRAPRHRGEIVVAVSHADPIKAAVAHALGTHLDLFQRIVVSPCSVTAIAYGADGPSCCASTRPAAT